MTLAKLRPVAKITDVKWRSSPHEARRQAFFLFITGAIAVGGTGPVHTAATGLTRDGKHGGVSGITRTHLMWRQG